MSDADPLKPAYATALRFLSYRPRTEGEVRTRLRRRFAATTIEQVLGLLREEGMVDDVRFADHWRASRESHSPRSAWAIRRELVARGVDSAVAQEAVRDLDDEENAYRAGLKAAGKLTGADLATFRRRLWGYLRRRGFGDAVCRRTIQQLWEESGRRNESIVRE